ILTVFDNLSKNTKRSKLFRFVSDIPTVTNQRIKALMTGSIPGYIEFRENFGGTEINEDNLLKQFAQSNKKSIFLGDFIWEGMFPNAFVRSYFYPSLNPIDIYSNDEGIDSHIDEEWAKEDWDVLFAHYLGADHVGHSLKANHPKMEEILKKFNATCAKMAEKVDKMNKTIMVVFSDHGMLESGNHGGDSDKEKDAFLFAHVSKDLCFEEENQKSKTYNQTSLAPTMAILVNVPIPFENVGNIIRELVPIKSEKTSSQDFREKEMAKYLLKNNLQIFRNLQINVKNIKIRNLLKIELENFYLLQKKHLFLLKNDQNKTKFKQLNEEYDLLLRKLRDISLKNWIDFDYLKICKGLFVISMTTFLSLLLLLDLYCTNKNINFQCSTIMAIISFVLLLPTQCTKIVFTLLTSYFADNIQKLIFLLRKNLIFNESLIKPKKNFCSVRKIAVLLTFIFFNWTPIAYYQILYEKYWIFAILIIVSFFIFVLNSNNKANFIIILCALLSAHFFQFSKETEIYNPIKSSFLLTTITLSILHSFTKLQKNSFCDHSIILAQICEVSLFWILNVSNFETLPKTFLYCFNSVVIFSVFVSVLRSVMKGALKQFFIGILTFSLILYSSFILPFLFILLVNIAILAFEFKNFGIRNFDRSPIKTKFCLELIIWYFYLLGNLFYVLSGNDYLISSIDFRFAFYLFGFNFTSKLFVFLRTYFVFALCLTSIFVLIKITALFGLTVSKKRRKKWTKMAFEKAFLLLIFFNQSKILFSAVNLFFKRKHIVVKEVFQPKYLFDHFMCLFINGFLLFLTFLVRI
ncbi:hypothetical protein MHBO_001606, partial [Bonamia ostreae]